MEMNVLESVLDHHCSKEWGAKFFCFAPVLANLAFFNKSHEEDQVDEISHFIYRYRFPRLLCCARLSAFHVVFLSLISIGVRSTRVDTNSSVKKGQNSVGFCFVHSVTYTWAGDFIIQAFFLGGLLRNSNPATIPNRFITDTGQVCQRPIFIFIFT